MKYKAILLDSGKVLNGPVTGHWMIPPNFFEHIDKSDFYKIKKKERRYAFRKGMEYLDSVKTMKSLDDEFKHFCEFYKLFFSHLTKIKPTKKDITEIAKDLVYNNNKYKFYLDAVKVIPKLKESYVLAVVSNAWPSLDEVFKHNNFYKYFDAFINSSAIGATKPDAFMYTSALRAVNCKPNEAVFIDDRVKNCDGAKAVGISKTYLLCRDKIEYAYYKLTVRKHKVVKDLYEVYEDLLTSL